MAEPLGDHGEGGARRLWPLGPSTWPLSQRASSLLHVCYYKVFTCRGREILKVEYYFEYISSFFLTPPLAPQKASSLHGSLSPTPLRSKPHLRFLCMLCTILCLMCVSLSSQLMSSVADMWFSVFFSVQHGTGHDTGAAPSSGAHGDAKSPYHLCPRGAGFLDKCSADRHHLRVMQGNVVSHHTVQGARGH